MLETLKIFGTKGLSDDYRQQALVGRYSLLGVLASFLYLLLYIYSNLFSMSLGLGLVLVIYLGIYLLNRTRKNSNIASHLLLWHTNISLLAFNVILGGDSGSMLLYFPVTFATLTLFSNYRRSILLAYLFISIAFFLTSLTYTNLNQPLVYVEKSIIEADFFATYIIAIATTLASGYSLVRVHCEVKKRLEDNQNHYVALLAGVPDQILHFNLSGICLDFKAGISDKQARDKNNSDSRYIGQPLSRILPYKLSYKLLEKARNINKGESFTAFEWLNQPKLGSPTCQEFRVNRIRPGEFIAIIRDNTEKHQQQAHIKAKEVAEHAVKVKSDFLSSMSHEIRTPMNIVLGLSKLLIKDKSLSDDAIENAEAIRFSAENLLAIVNDILDLSKIEAGKLSIVPKTFNLAELVRRHVNFMKVYADDRELEVVSKIDPNLPKLLNGDDVRINQVLMNLTGNAVKFTQSGKVTVGIDVVKSTSQVVDLEFYVQDTGVGIPQEKLRYIFEQFSQLQDENGSRTGTGLGLTISQRIVQLMGGTISAESTLGIGSKFSFTLRLPIELNTALASNKAINTTENIDLDGLKVLLAEDNSMNQFYAKQLLESWNVEVDLASNGIEVLHKARQTRYDIILMDLQMPVMDGLEAIKELRNNIGTNRETPVICVSADAFEETKDKALSAGMNDYLTKPIDEAALIDIITTYTGIAKPEFTSSNKSRQSSTQENLPLLDLDSLSPVLLDDSLALNEFLTLFVRSVREDMDRLSSSILMNDNDQAGKLAHKLKSSYRNIGAIPSARLLEQIESQSSQNPFDQQFLGELYRELMIQYQAITLTIKNRMSAAKSAV